MCCEKCTNFGITTEYGQELLKNVGNERWRIAGVCPQFDPYKNPKKEDRMMWGICRATSELERVECCWRCKYFS